MSEFDDISDRDERVREPKEGEYSIPSLRAGEVVGLIVCSRPGLRLIDFYRTSDVLAKDVKTSESGKPVVGPGADRMPSQGGSTPPAGATPQNIKGGQV